MKDTLIMKPSLTPGGGGGNGDSTLCRPVYVGEHWDVLVQTLNCQEMLRYLRPRRDVRTIWVDAICINQRDLNERQTQVAKMGSVFESSVRTIVYLGPDIVLPASTSSPYPRRYYLQDLDILSDSSRPIMRRLKPSQHITLTTLFDRNYFQRLWIIQELLVSRDITFGIGDVEFTITRRVGHPPTPEAWPISSFEDGKVPWFKYITQGTVEDGGEDSLITAIDLASNSKCADPRDMVFGVLGMIQHEGRINPSYSISFRHLVIGYSAYYLTVKKDMRVIVHAAGLEASANMPSWAPHAYRAGTKTPAIPRLGGVDREILMLNSNGFLAAYQRHHSPEVSVTSSFPELKDDSHPKTWAKFEGWNPKGQGQTCWKVKGGQISHHSPGLQDVLPQFTNEDDRHWHSCIKFDTLTGALLEVSALHILCFGQAGLTLTETYLDEGIYTYIFRNGTSSLFLYSQEACFDSPTVSSDNHLFALCDKSTGDDPSHDKLNSRLCILRSAVDKNAFQLVSASVYVCLHTLDYPTNYPGPRKFWKEPTWNKLHIQDMSPLHIRSARDDASPTAIPVIRRQVVNRILGASHWADWNRRLKPTWRRRHQILPVEELHGDLGSMVRKLRASWISAQDYSPGHSHFLNFDGQIDRPYWICIAFPGVTGPTAYRDVLHAAFLLESGVKGSVNSFLELYFRLVESFEPHSLEDLLSRDEVLRTAVGSETLVALCFKPHQRSILKEAIRLIGKCLYVSLKQIDTHPQMGYANTSE